MPRLRITQSNGSQGGHRVDLEFEVEKATANGHGHLRPQDLRPGSGRPALVPGGLPAIPPGSRPDHRGSRRATDGRDRQGPLRQGVPLQRRRTRPVGRVACEARQHPRGSGHHGRRATAIPWELIRDPKTDVALALRAAVFARVHPQPVQRPQVPKTRSGPIRILLVICRPRADDDVPFRSVASRLIKGLSEQNQAIYQLDVLRPPTFEQLAKVLRRAKERKQALPRRPLRWPRDVRQAGGRRQRHSDPSATVPCHLLGPAPPGGTASWSSRTRSTRTTSRSSTVPCWATCWSRPAWRCSSSTPAGAPTPMPRAIKPDAGRRCPRSNSRAGANLRLARAGGDGRGRAGRRGDALQRLRRHRRPVRGRPVRRARARPDARRGGDDGPEATSRQTRPHHRLRPCRLAGLVRAGRLRVDADRALPGPEAGRRADDQDPGRRHRSRGSQLDEALPRPPDAGFFGRDETLLALDRAFDKQRIVLLHAYAGSGKTATAAEFARWYSPRPAASPARCSSLASSSTSHCPRSRPDRGGVRSRSLEQSGQPLASARRVSTDGVMQRSRS